MKSKINSILSSRLFKSFSYLTIAQGITSIVAFFTTMYIARILGPEYYGKLGFAQALLSYFALFVNLGLDIYAVREIAKNKSKAKKLINNILAIKTILFFVTYFLLIIVVNLLPKDDLTKKIIYIYGFTLFSNAFIIEWFFQGFESFRIIALGQIIRSFIYASLIFSLIRYKEQVLEVVWFQLFSGLFIVVFLIKNAIRFIDFKYISPKLWIKYIKVGIILAGSFFMITIYYNMDKIMIGLWFPDKYVGWYSAAYKMVTITLIMNGIFWKIFSPRIARFSISDIKRFIKLMLFFGVLSMSILLLFKEFIITTIFGLEYLQSIKPLSILAFNVLLVYINVAFVSPLMLWGKEKVYFFIISSGAITNFIMNFLLIPRHDINGAAIATVSAELAVFIFGFPVFLKYYKERKKLCI